jgi:hypothetical protein
MKMKMKDLTNWEVDIHLVSSLVHTLLCRNTNLMDTSSLDLRKPPEEDSRFLPALCIA